MADLEKGNTTAAASGANHTHTGVFGDNSTPAFRNSPTSSVKNVIANPGSLGLFSFASTTLILSLYNVTARGVNIPNVVVGMALFCGGLGQFMAGMWEFPKGNTFGATAFTSYGCFWLSYATILIPGSGITAAYQNSSEENNAIGIYLMAWMTVTFLLLIASLRKNIGFIALFFFLGITFMFLGAGSFVAATSSTSLHLTKTGGALGIITALIAYYVGLSELLAAERAAVVGLPIGVFKHD